MKRKEREIPAPGTKFVKKRKGKVYEMTVENVDGRIKYVVSGHEFSSPSGAAKFITQSEVNGWRFWGI